MADVASFILLTRTPLEKTIHEEEVSNVDVAESMAELKVVISL